MPQDHVVRADWPGEAVDSDGNTVPVLIMTWNYDTHTGIAEDREHNRLDVYMESYADGDLTIGKPQTQGGQ